MTNKPKSTAKPKRAAAPAPTIKRAAPKPAKAPDTPLPTIGRIVHVYDHALGVDGHAGRGAGPYAAIVTHVRPAVEAVEATDEAPATGAEPETVDVVIFAPAMGGGHERGALPFRPGYDASAPFQGVHRYWTWPPRS